MSTTKDKEIKQACTDVVLLKHRLGELGLYKSMQAMEEVTKVVGWEVAEYIFAEVKKAKGLAVKKKADKHLDKVLKTINRPKGSGKQVFGKKRAKK